jgi:hypothetical protein
MSRSSIKTIAFFEIVRAKDAQSPRMGAVDWQRALARIEGKSAEERIFASDTGSYIGQVVTVGGQKHLLVGKIGPGNLETVDLDLGNIEELQLQGNKGTIETTAVCFLSYGNVVGVLQGSMSAPRITSVQGWINACGMTSEEIAAWPVISSNAWEVLRNSEAVHGFEFTYRPNPLIPPPRGTRLASFARQGSEWYPDHRITVKIEVPKTRDVSPTARLRGQRQLRRDVENLLSELGYLKDSTGVTRARANVTVQNDDGEFVDTPLDFILHRVTVKQRINYRASAGRPRYEVSVEAILESARDCEEVLRAAVSA